MFNYKLNVPYTLLIAVIVGLCASSLLAVSLTFGLLELLAGLIIFHKLKSIDSFEYNSFYGILLKEYTTFNYIDITDLLHILCARVAVAALGLFAVIFTPWLYVPSIVLLLLTVVHKKAQ